MLSFWKLYHLNESELVLCYEKFVVIEFLTFTQFFFFFLIFLFIYGFDNLIAATTFLLETVIVLANDSFVWRSIVSPRA